MYWRLQRRLVPGLRHAQDAFVEVLERNIGADPIWLDLGCGRRTFATWLQEEQDRILPKAKQICGVDLDLESLREHTLYPDKVLATGYQLPFKSDAFDLVSANMVVEHVDDADRLLGEIRRVIRPGGRFVFVTPNRRNLLMRLAAATPGALKAKMARLFEHRQEQDVFRTFYVLNSRQDIEAAAARAGLRVAEFHHVNSVAYLAVLGPLAIPELLWLRLISRHGYEHWRTNIVAVLERPRES